MALLVSMPAFGGEPYVTELGQPGIAKIMMHQDGSGKNRQAASGDFFIKPLSQPDSFHS